MYSIRSIILIIALLYTIDIIQGKPTSQSMNNNFKIYVKYLLTILGTENEYTRFLSFMKIHPPEDVKMKAFYNDLFSFNSYRSDLMNVYEKYYTTDEIIQLINFYSSPLGRKHLHISQEVNRQMEDTMLTKISDYIFTSAENGFDIPLP
jgi:hypothetical protein